MRPSMDAFPGEPRPEMPRSNFSTSIRKSWRPRWNCCSESDRVGAKVAHARRAGSPACERQREHGQRLRKGGPGVWPRPVGENPLARLVVKSDLARITRSDVDSWVARVHNLRNAALIVVGDVKADEVVEYADPAVAQVRRARMGG